MNNKFLLQDLTDQLSEKGNLKKKDAEEFLKAFFMVIEDSLFEGEVVKIPGLGTFKLLQVDSRKSVNVTTGQEIEIKEHYKVSFTPDATLKETVNTPFSHLDPVELDRKAEISKPVEKTYSPKITRVSEQNDIYDRRKPVEPETDDDKYKPKSADVVKPETTTHTRNYNEPPKERFRNEVRRDHDEVRRDHDDLRNNPNEPRRNSQDVWINSDEKKKTNQTKRVSGHQYQQTKQTQGKPIWLIVVIVAACVIIWALKSNQDAKKEKETKLQEMQIDTLAFEETKPEELVPKIKDSLQLEKEIEEQLKAMDKEPKSPKAEDKSDLKKTVKAEVKTPVKKSVIAAEEPVKTVETVSGVNFPVFVTLEKGDRLTMLALKYYGHKAFWVYIYLANRNVITDPNHIPLGTKIRIPKPDASRINANDPKCITKAKAIQTKILSM